MREYRIGRTARAWKLLSQRMACFFFLCLPVLASAQITAWGDNTYGEVSGTSGLTNVKQVSGGEYFAVALNNDGTITQWGDTSNNETNNYPAGITGVTQVSAGAFFALALKDDGTVVQWGDETRGEGTPPSGGSNRFISVAAGQDFSLALNDEGYVQAWGDSTSGATNPTHDRATAIAAGNEFGLALKSDGTVVEWGSGIAFAVPTGLSEVKAIAAGPDFALALKSDGTVVGWGTTFAQNVPAGLSGVIAVAAGEADCVALKSDGTIVVWGGPPSVPAGLTNVAAISAGGFTTYALAPSNTATAWGMPSSSGISITPGLAGVKQVSAGKSVGVSGFGLALLTNGTVSAFGDDSSGQTTVPAGLSHVIQVSAGFTSCAALLDNGTVVCWGEDFQQQTDVPSGLSGVVSVVAGYACTLALLDNGTVVAWGYGGSGQVPVGLHGLKQIATVNLFAAALLDDGTVRAWGDDTYFESEPDGLYGIKEVATGASHGLALSSKGTVAAWGSHIDGESNVPAGLTGVISVSAGYVDSMALTSGGTVSAWGENLMNQISVPKGLSNASQLSAGAGVNLLLSPPLVNGISLSPTALIGGNTTECSVSISPPAGFGGATVAISGTGPVTLPSSVIVPAGQSSYTFQLGTAVESSDSPQTITATYNGTTATADLDVQPITLTSFTLPAVVGGTSDTGMVTLSTNAGPAGATVTLLTTGPNNITLSIPTSITVAAGTNTGSFTFVTPVVSAAVQISVQASLGSSSITDSFTINPALVSSIACYPTAVTGGTLANFTVTLGGPAGTGGDTVTLSGTGPITLPASVVVPAGSNTVSFTAPTSVVSSPINEQVTASTGFPSQNTTLTVNPATVSTIVVSPTSIPGGSNAETTLQLNGPAGPSGNVVTLDSNNLAVTVPASVTVPAGATSYSFLLKTMAVNGATNATITATVNGVPTTARVTVLASGLASFTMPPTIPGGASAEAYVTLASPAGSSGAVVSLSSQTPSILRVPASVTVPAGASTYWFLVKAAAVSTQQAVRVTATLGSSSASSSTSVLPASLSNLTVAPNTVGGGTPSEATVTLSGPAAAGTVVSVQSSNTAAATVLSSVTVPAGLSALAFEVRTLAVGASTPVTITATLGSVSKSASFTVTPATLASFTVAPGSVAGGSNAEGTIHLSGPAATAVIVGLTSGSSSVVLPASVTIPAGSSSYSFLVKTKAVVGSTNATLTATVGNTFETATLTVTP